MHRARRLAALVANGPTSSGSRWPLLQRVRWRFALLVLVGVVLAPFTAPYMLPRSLATMVGYLVVMASLGCWAVALYRYSADSRLLNAAGPALIGLLGVVTGDAAWAFGPLFAALFLHSLYGQRRAVLRRAFGYFLAYEIAILITGGTEALLGPQLLSIGLGLAIVSLVMLEMARSLRSGDDLRRRDELVSAATPNLLAADGPEEVGAVAAEVVRDLVEDALGEAPDQVTVWREELDTMHLLAVRGLPPRTEVIPLGAMDETFQEHYRDARTLRLPPAAMGRLRRLTGRDQTAGHGLSLPLVGTGGVVGAVFVRGPRPVPDELLPVLHRFADEASLALAAVRQHRMLREVMANSADGIVLADARGDLQFVSRAVEDLCGREVEIGRPLGDVLGVAPTGRPATGLADLLVHADRLVVRAADGDRPVEVSSREVPGEGIVLNLRDVTQQRRLQEEIRFRAFHDAVTGLPNRVAFLDQLDAALRREPAGDEPVDAVGVAVFDLDDFKAINDEHGHLVGDRVLAAVAQRVRDRLRGDDVFARLGGDEFALLIDRLTAEDDAVALARDLLDVIRAPLDVDGLHVGVGASCGLVVTEGCSAEEAIGDADLAMYAAKAAGKGEVVRFDVALREQLTERRLLLEQLAHAIQNGQLIVHYQPVLTLCDERLVGVEALVRWEHPTRGLIPPNAFVPLAEEYGLIGGLGRAVLERAVAECAGWVADGAVDTDFQVHVNLSARQLAEVSLVRDVLATLQRWQLDPGRLVLEITETALAQDPDHAEATLRRLADAGIEIAIDDFGTGYASFTYLRRFPVSVVKVDRSFVADVLRGPESAGLSHAIIRLAQNLGLTTVAEGIEESAARDLLASWGCERGQGWLWSRALPADELLAWMGRARAVAPVVS